MRSSCGMDLQQSDEMFTSAQSADEHLAGNPASADKLLL